MRQEIMNGDCIKLFSGINDNTVRTTFADPPFNLEKGYSGYSDDRKDEAYISWCEEWISEMVRVTQPGGSLFLHNIPKWLVHYAHFLSNKDVDFQHWISWDAPTRPMGKSLQPAHYGILYYTKRGDDKKFYEIRSPHRRLERNVTSFKDGNVKSKPLKASMIWPVTRVHFVEQAEEPDFFPPFMLKDYGGKKETIHPFGPLVSDVWTDIFRVKHDKYRDEHPCQLPIHLLERIVLMSSDEGDIVLDPFMGTGTTAIAAKRLGRDYIGFEQSKEYVKAAEKKLSREVRKSKLEDGLWVSCFLDDLITIRHSDLEKVLLHYDIPQDHRELDFIRIKLKSETQKLVTEFCA